MQQQDITSFPSQLPSSSDRCKRKPSSIESLNYQITPTTKKLRTASPPSHTLQHPSTSPPTPPLIFRSKRSLQSSNNDQIDYPSKRRDIIPSGFPSFLPSSLSTIVQPISSPEFSSIDDTTHTPELGHLPACPIQQSISSSSTPAASPLTVLHSNDNLDQNSNNTFSNNINTDSVHDDNSNQIILYRQPSSLLRSDLDALRRSYDPSALASLQKRLLTYSSSSFMKIPQDFKGWILTDKNHPKNINNECDDSHDGSSFGGPHQQRPSTIEIFEVDDEGNRINDNDSDTAMKMERTSSTGDHAMKMEKTSSTEDHHMQLD